MKIAVIGANGQLGSDVVAAFSENGDLVRGLTHADGLCHTTAEGGCSSHGFVQEIFVLTDTPIRLKAAVSASFQPRWHGQSTLYLKIAL